MGTVSHMKLIGVDVGGTFTDLVLTDTETQTISVHKVPSTPHDPSIAVVRGITEICQRTGTQPKDIAHVHHGTTVATNAVLEFKGARAGMITTQGFRDVVHIGRHQRPHHYSIMQEIPWQARPLVRRRHRKTVSERLIPPHGEVLTALDEDAVRHAARELREAKVEAIAICFLFSYLNPAHEARAKAIVQKECPDLFVTTSHEVSPQYREFERFTTALMNAFIGPLVRRYVTNLNREIRNMGIGGELHIMRSNGGVATTQSISELPIYTLMSGLAAGILAGKWVGELAGRSNIIAFDMGGTSADIGVVTDGQFTESSARDTFVGGYPVMVPMIDLHTIGAGGGSIAHVDTAGVFRVGPQSAGAVPGPAAYGAGGTKPTVTDANLVLGRLDKDHFLGGAMPLDAKAAEAAIRGLSKELGLSLHETAEGVVAVVNANMANAIRARTVQKGIDPRDYTLMASGGAGPLHGAEVAKLLGIPEVIVPTHPGIASAMGLLTTDLKYDAFRTAFQISTNVDYERLNAGFGAMEAQLLQQLRQDGIDSATARIVRYIDARYVGQGYELRFEVPAGKLDENSLTKATEGFHRAHHNEYGHSFPAQPVELVNLRVTANGPVRKIGKPAGPRGVSVEAAQLKRGAVWFRTPQGMQSFDTPFYRRSVLPAGTALPGPAIILQEDTTTVVPPDCTFRVDASGMLLIRTA